MTEQSHVWDLLVALRDHMKTSVPLRITAINAAVGGLSLENPTAYLITSDRADRTGLPELLLSTEGPADHDDWLTAHTDITAPIRVDVIYAGDDDQDDDEASADRDGWYYTRAVQEALDGVTAAATGIWHVDVTDVDVEQYDDSDRNRRAAIVRADVKFRTTRAIANP